MNVHAGGWEGIGGESLLGHPLVAQELGHVIARGVREQNNDAILFGEVVVDAIFVKTPHGRSARPTDHHAFMTDKCAGVSERFGIAGFVPDISQVALQNGGDEIVTDTLDVVGRADTCYYCCS